MKLRHLLLCSLASLYVLALDNAVPWELQMFYQVYKAEWVAGVNTPDRVGSIASRCKRVKKDGIPANSDFDAGALANGVVGMCSFDDFVKHIGSQKSFRDWRWDALGDKWDFDADYKAIDAKFKLSITSLGEPVQYDFTKLLPKEEFTVRPVPFKPVIELVYDALYAARQFAAKSNDAGRIQAVEGMARKAGEYARIAMQFRALDTARYAGRDVDTLINDARRTDSSYPITRINKSVQILAPAPFTGAIQGSPNEVDFERTLTVKSDGTANGATKRQRNEFRAQFTTTQARGAAEEVLHRNVIKSLHTMIEDISANRARSCSLGRMQVLDFVEVANENNKSRHGFMALDDRLVGVSVVLKSQSASVQSVVDKARI